VLEFWDPALRPLLEAASARVIVEVGTFNGDTTVRLLDFARESGCVVHSIDPRPRPKLDLPGLRQRYGDSFVFHQQTSLDALAQIADADVVLIDGDHNWYTVHNELRLLASRAAEQNRAFPLTFLHDIDWPYGRRDLYYEPDAIPKEHRRPFRRGGVIPGQTELSEFGINAGKDHAVEENTPHNGVRTAVEDFLVDTDLELCFQTVVGFHGLGILVSRKQLEQNEALRRLLDEFRSAKWLQEQCQRLEASRIGLLVARRELKLELRKARMAEQEGGGVGLPRPSSS
jgi:hypothetical protein